MTAEQIPLFEGEYMPSNPLHLSKSNRWFTPPWLVEKCRDVLGGIELDPASEESANRIVRAERFFTEADDGLKQDWISSSILLNPPGGTLKRKSLARLFWEKLMLERGKESFGHAIVIGFSLEQLQRTQSDSGLSMMDFNFCVPKKRIKFLDHNMVEQKSPSHGNVIVYVDGSIDESLYFESVFRSVGGVV